MKSTILTTATILLIGLTSATPMFAQNGNFNNIDRSINAAYQEFLGRDADANGLRTYRNLIINGRSIDDVRNEIGNSPEARNRNGNYNRNNNSYRNDNYNRNDNSYRNDNYNGNSYSNRPDLDRAINAAYQEILGRNADANGLRIYRNLMINGRSIDDVRNEIANSPEARNRNDNSYRNDDYYRSDDYYRNDNSNGLDLGRLIDELFQAF